MEIEVVSACEQMDKESIVGDAISYVLDLQKKVQEIQDEMKVLLNSNRPDHHTQLTPKTIEPLTNVDCASSMKNLPDKLVKHGKILEVSTNISLQLSIINGIFSGVIRYSHKVYACARYS